MKKRLLNKDYQSIVLEALKLPETDFYNYYLNLVEENFRYNPNIIEQLKSVLAQWVQWYNSKIYGRTVEVKMKDGTVEIMNENQTFDVDKNGKRTPHKMEETLIPLVFDFDIKRSVNRSFFETQLEKIELIQQGIKLKEQLIRLEETLPEEAKAKLTGNPMPEGFDFTDIKERFDIVKAILEKQTTPLTSNTQELISNLNKYGFTEFLNKKNLNTSSIFGLLSKHSGKEQMPYSIALLNEIEYLKYFFKEFTSTKKEGHKKLAIVFNVKERRIRGNINVLNPKSEENRTNYTSINYKEEAQEELKGLRKGL